MKRVLLLSIGAVIVALLAALGRPEAARADDATDGLRAYQARRYADAAKHFDAAIQHNPNYRLARVARRDVRAAAKLVGPR